MNQNSDYMTARINALNAEINDLKNRQIATEIQLAHTLEKAKMRREFYTKLWNEIILWVCMMLGILLTGIALNLH